jgi:thiosulfate/3-mercaptopyruvate sulfurtransferase
MSSSIVSTDWLASHLDQSGLVIIDCRKSKPGINPPIDFHGKYLEAHIPGAVYIEVDDISDCSTGLPHMLPDAEAFSKSMSERGISNNSAVVLYDEGDLFSAPRVWWMLTRFGANNVRILDGGLNAWLKEGKRTEGGERKLPPANFEARLESQVVVSAEQVQIIDARSLGRFRGEQPEPRPGLHGGHIPGSLSVPFTELTENGRIKSPQALKETFSRLGVDTTQRTISSCGSGVTAAALLFGLHLIGAEDVLIYDGSWAEWGDINKDYPIETQ